MVEIIPSILASDKLFFTLCIEGIKGVAQTVQIDLADGVFVPQPTWAYEHPTEAMALLRTTDVELHFMTANPVRDLEVWVKTKRLVRVLLHVESLVDPVTELTRAKDFGLPVHIVLKPDTPLSVIEPLLSHISGVMLMGVTPGLQGQPFVDETIERVRALRQMHPSLRIAVDGGVNEKTLPTLAGAGVSAVCPGSAIFKNDLRPEENMKNLRALLG